MFYRKNVTEKCDRKYVTENVGLLGKIMELLILYSQTDLKCSF